MGALVLGYHGCDRDFGEALLAGTKKFRPSKNQYDWLGHGVYFWENNPKRAFEWAKFMANHPKFKGRVKNPFAVGVIVDLGNCLDLTESISLKFVEEGYRSLSEMFDFLGVDLPVNEAASENDEDLLKRNLDCAVINHVHSLREDVDLEPFDTVRGAFHEGPSLYPGACIKQKTHIQICVRNPSMIKGIFRLESKYLK